MRQQAAPAEVGGSGPSTLLTVDAARDADDGGPIGEIAFPAAILQPRCFSSSNDPAINCSGIGAVIGHAMTHGFDDQGRMVEASGASRDWWTLQDASHATATAQVLGV